LTKAWRGGEAVIAVVDFPGKKQPRRLSVLWSEGARAARAARWPDVLADWGDIYGEKLFDGDAVPVLCEEASGLGADALAIHGEAGLLHATVAWYAKGAVAEYEKVALGGSVAWQPGEPLGRPFDGSLRSALAWGGRKLAEKVGTSADETLFERMEKTNQAIGEALVNRALWRILDVKPPSLDELAGMVAGAPQRRFQLKG